MHFPTYTIYVHTVSLPRMILIHPSRLANSTIIEFPYDPPTWGVLGETTLAGCSYSTESITPKWPKSALPLL